MSEIDAIYQIWKREIIRYFRDKYRLAGSIFQPILFLLILGSGFSFVKIGDLNYQKFLFPGIVAMSLVGISLTAGISVIWDREFGFFKEIEVSPISRLSIFLGKAFGGCTIALIQGIIIASLSFIIGLNLPPIIFLKIIPIMILISFSMVSLGLIISSYVETFESFGVIMNFIVFPLNFLSGIFYPVTQVPEWLKIITHLNPLSYGVDLMRYAIIDKSFMNPVLDVLIVILFCILAAFIGVLSFNRKK
ncbi:MAG: ABC transporter permease [Candidatus Aenigmatarchaeota archaeon]|nr:ABC transporter permease [Candidatus Aenigmarchaeota archaeon]